MSIDENLSCSFQIMKPAEQKISQMVNPRPNTPPRVKSMKYWNDFKYINIFMSEFINKKYTITLVWSFDMLADWFVEDFVEVGIFDIVDWAPLVAAVADSEVDILHIHYDCNYDN